MVPPLLPSLRYDAGMTTVPLAEARIRTVREQRLCMIGMG